MIILIASLVLAMTAVAAGAWWWRGAFLRDQPLQLWGRDWPSGESAANAAAKQMGLSTSRLPDDRAWLTDLVFAPVWLFWGDLRTRRPERHLRRWRLAGTRDGREVTILFGKEDLRLAVSTRAPASIWAEAPGRALDQQEGLRVLFPVGTERWKAGVSQLDQAFSLGASRVHTEDGAIVALVLLGVAMPPPERWPMILDALSQLATVLEG